MPDTLLDSTLCIDLVRGVAEARDFVMSVRATGQVLQHTAVLAEITEGARGRADFKAIDDLVATTTPLVPSDHDLAASILLLRRHGPATGAQWHDCLIAATGLRLGAIVATANDKHFRVFRPLRVIRPY